MEQISPGDALGLRILAAQYFQVVDVQQLRFLPGAVLLRPQVQHWINEHMFREDAVWPLPPVSYRSRVLKLLLSKLEESFSDPDQDEISDDLMASWSNLIIRPRPSPLEQTQQLSYIKYTPPFIEDPRCSDGVITLENRGLLLSSGTTGFRTWEASLHLGTFLSTAAGRELVKHRNVLELGSGTGFLAMYCLKCLGANRVMATDREPALMSNIQKCISQNKLDPDRISAGIWEWGTPLDFRASTQETGQSCPFDIALGADLTYDVDLIPLLLSALQDLFDNHSLKEFIIAAAIRNQSTFDKFLGACEKRGLRVEAIDFRSPRGEDQTGFFHSTDTPILTHKVTPL